MQGDPTRPDPARCPVPAAGASGQRAERWHADPRALREAAWLRLGAAVIAGLGGAWLWAATEAWVLRAVAIVSLAFALLWTRSQVRVLRADASVADYLELSDHHLAIVHGHHARSLPLADVCRVALDHDRLRVVIELASGEELSVEPRYLGPGLAELGDRIQRAVAAARPDASG